MLLAIYGSLPGVIAELAGRGSDYSGWNIAGFPHQVALGLGSWILLALLTITMAANLWQRRRGIYALGMLLAFSSVIPLSAGRFEGEVATASAWRWLAALLLLAISAPLWYRENIWRQLKASGWSELDMEREELSLQIRTLLLALTLAPLLFLTIYPALRAIYYLPMQGPTSGIFSFMDDEFRYGVPLVLCAGVLIGYAIRERIVDYAFVAGLFCNVTVTMIYLLSVVAVGGSMNRVVLARAIQLNAVTFSLYALVWLSRRMPWQTALDQDQVNSAERWLDVQVGIAIGLNALLILPVVTRLVLSPLLAGIGTVVAGSYLGWLSFILTSVAFAWLVIVRGKKFSAGVLAGVLSGVSCLLALSWSDRNVAALTGLHTLTVAMTVSAWLMLLVSMLPFDGLDAIGSSNSALRWWRSVFDPGDAWQAMARGWAALIGGVATLLALRPELHDPSGDWWAIVPLVAISALAGMLNWQTLRRSYIYAAGMVFSIAVSVWWLNYFFLSLPSVSAFIEVNIIASCPAGILLLCLELRARKLSGTETQNTSFSYHNLVCLLSLFVWSSIVSISLTFGPSHFSPIRDMPGLCWLTLISVAALMTACIWDRHSRYAVAGLYAVGLVASAIALEELELSYTRQWWVAMIFVAIYALLTSVVWRGRNKLMALAWKLGMPQRLDPAATELKWLSAFNIFAVATVILIAYWIDLRFLDFSLRSSAALAVVAQAFTFGLLAEGVSRDRWQRSAIGAFMVGAVFFGWAFLVPSVTGTWLNRSVILMVEAFAFTAVYALGPYKISTLHSVWATAVRFCVPWILGIGVVALFFCLATEIFYQISFGAVRVWPLSLLTIGLTLVVSVVICILFALSPKHDPLSLSERGRMRYVYAAEMMLALLFLHIRLTIPWLFTGFFERYWPFAVMSIAYLGVVSSEALRRRKLLVLAQPIERTGAFLPLLPVLGFWLAQSAVDYSLLLFVVGGLYGLLSLLRRSFAFGVLAAIAGNSGLWYFWQRSTNYQFLQHPQLWLIPVALSVLLAAYLNEEDFTEDQMAAIRYLALVTIYASSTADIFINGVANSPWLPLLLGAFSLVGVFAGILFRIRGLLLLGSVFLLLAIITMIWYASANLGWTWLWYVAGIVTGATIIFMFAVFEKKRGEVLRVVEGLKDWDR